ncbi:hypothetical protein FG386_003088 [Cryptosporidium ryanae]|uniref:uncharacterized protein n=1 Tax=Cryptosporidium ryanae TaxID=515981 RepID=UPI00351A9C7D|nr:hypothetical protein FG386_003088 [Cryptosporidium ryanae]
MSFKITVFKVFILAIGLFTVIANCNRISVPSRNGRVLSSGRGVPQDNESPQIPVATRSDGLRFPAQRIRTKSSKTDELMQKYMSPMMKLPELNYQYISSIMNRFNTIILSLLVIPFIILSLFGDTNDFIFTQFGFISGIFGFCMGIMLFVGLLPDSLTIAAAITIGVMNSYSTLKLTKVREMPHVSILFFCFLLSNLIYHLMAGIGNYALNPLYTGIGGALLMRVSKLIGYNFDNIKLFTFALKVCYISIVSLLSLTIYALLPTSLKYSGGANTSASSGHSFLNLNKTEKNSDEEISRLQKYTQSISSFILTYPIVAFISQITYIFGIFMTSPFDPISFFYIPSQLHLNYYSTFILITTWLVLVIFTFLFRTKMSNRDSFQPKFVKSLISEKWRLNESS